MNFFTHISDIKNFLGESMHAGFVFLACLCLVLLGFVIKINSDIHRISLKIDNQTVKITEEIQTNRDKIHFRYFNLTRSLEDLNDVKIDTKNGRLER